MTFRLGSVAPRIQIGNEARQHRPFRCYFLLSVLLCLWPQRVPVRVPQRSPLMEPVQVPIKACVLSVFRGFFQFRPGFHSRLHRRSLSFCLKFLHVRPSASMIRGYVKVA